MSGMLVGPLRSSVLQRHAWLWSTDVPRQGLTPAVIPALLDQAAYLRFRDQRLVVADGDGLVEIIRRRVMDAAVPAQEGLQGWSGACAQQARRLEDDFAKAVTVSRFHIMSCLSSPLGPPFRPRRSSRSQHCGDGDSDPDELQQYEPRLAFHHRDISQQDRASQVQDAVSD